MKTDVLRLVATYKCNYNCKYCLARDVPQIEGTISKKRMEKAADYTSRCGAQEFSITGGEPSLIDLSDYIETAARYFGKISLLSNGSKLTNEILKKYIDLGLTNLSLNVPCITEEAYITLTGGTKQSFQHLLKLIEESSKLDGLVLRLNCVLVSGINDSLEYVDKFIKFAKDNNVKQLNFSELIPAQNYAIAMKSPIVEIENHLTKQRKAIPSFVLDWGFRCYLSDSMSMGCFQYPLNNRGEHQGKDYYVNLFLMPDGYLRYDFWNPESVIM